MARANADLEIVDTKAAETKWRERERVAKVAKLKKALEEAKVGISVLRAENSELWIEKASVEADLDKTIDNTLVMLGQSFNQVV